MNTDANFRLLRGHRTRRRHLLQPRLDGLELPAVARATGPPRHCPLQPLESILRRRMGRKEGFDAARIASCLALKNLEELNHPARVPPRPSQQLQTHLVGLTLV